MAVIHPMLMYYRPDNAFEIPLWCNYEPNDRAFVIKESSHFLWLFEDW